MTFLSSPKGYTKQEFESFVHSLKWYTWRPKFITLHNCSEPSIKTWNEGYAKHGGSMDDYELWRIHNLNSFYKAKGWHSGPHLFVSPNKIWNACDLTRDGVSVSCWNHLTIGVEMVGEFATEDFNSGDGAKVRDLTIFALAVLHKALNITPLPYMVSTRGLHPHKACVRDHHDCPGKNVDMDWVRKAVIDEIKELV